MRWWRFDTVSKRWVCRVVAEIAKLGTETRIGVSLVVENWELIDD